jgi:hypothetical protein
MAARPHQIYYKVVRISQFQPGEGEASFDLANDDVLKQQFQISV